ncbi:hypothetical protein OS493_032508 [Desmophyllum pertusum]|nr:hypothetical protein OS493_032508 [Desmophyllum pertusum]
MKRDGKEDIAEINIQRKQSSSEYRKKLRRKSRLNRKYKSGEWILDRPSQPSERKGQTKESECEPSKTDGRNPIGMNSLSNEILEEIFQHVHEGDGDAAIARLSLVCRRWKEVVGTDHFRRRVHFLWLSTLHDWQKASAEFNDTYYVMYDVGECFGCNKRYKSMPGYQGSRGSLVFYSDTEDVGHAGYCSEFCARVLGNYEDPFDDWEGI